MHTLVPATLDNEHWKTLTRGYLCMVRSRDGLPLQRGDATVDKRIFYDAGNNPYNHANERFFTLLVTMAK